MRKRVRVDRAGRVVIPKQLRERYGLRADRELELIDTGEELRLRPQGEQARVHARRNGWIVFGGSLPEGLSIPEAIEAARVAGLARLWP